MGIVIARKNAVVTKKTATSSTTWAETGSMFCLATTVVTGGASGSVVCEGCGSVGGVCDDGDKHEQSLSWQAQVIYQQLTSFKVLLHKVFVRTNLSAAVIFGGGSSIKFLHCVTKQMC
nr:hypothetical protein CFP56_32751 [Quercus suber]